MMNLKPGTAVHTGDKVEFNTVDFVILLKLWKSTKLTVSLWPRTHRQESWPYWRQSTLIVADLSPVSATVCCRKKPATNQQLTFNKVDRVEFNFVATRQCVPGFTE